MWDRIWDTAVTTVGTAVALLVVFGGMLTDPLHFILTYLVVR